MEPTNNNQMTPESEGNTTEVVQKVSQGQEGQLPPKLQKEISGWRTILMKLIHSKKTRDVTMKLLQSSEMEMAVPNAALTIQAQAEKISKGRVSNNAKLAGAVYMVTDLLTLGAEAGLWEVPDEQTAGLILQDTLQDYIENGLADGTIDPVRLQLEVEPLMTAEQRKVGEEFAQKGGVPMEPSETMVAYNNMGMSEKKKKLAQMQKPVQGQPQTPQGQQPQKGVLGG